MLKRLIVLAFLALVQLPSTALAQGAAGQAVDVRAKAQIVSGGETRTLVQGNAVSSGDVVRTGESGRVQILFPDQTKIVVGPNSTLKIDETLFRANGTAKKFVATAVGGSFRFISGKSAKNVYKLATPVATMGIRGTVFDFTVNAEQSTDLLVFDGLVRFCAAGQLCASVPGGCQAVTVERGGEFSQPESDADKLALLTRRFPLLSGQSDLQPPFRAETSGCDVAVLISLPRQRVDGETEERAPTREPERGGNPADGPSDSPGGGGNPAE
jgi:hypothetical protein